MKVEFHFAESLHPNSDSLTIQELAQLLEDKYAIVEQFCQQITQTTYSEWDLSTKSRKAKRGSLVEFVAEKISRKGFVRIPEVEEWVKNEWRKTARDGKLGGYAGAAILKRKEAANDAIERRGGKVKRQNSTPRPFVDTQAYFMSLEPHIVLEPEDTKYGLLRP